MDFVSPHQFHGVHMNGISFLRVQPAPKNQIFETDFVDGVFVKELHTPSVQVYENTVRRLRSNNLIGFVSNNIAVFQSFRCPSRDTLFQCSFNWE